MSNTDQTNKAGIVDFGALMGEVIAENMTSEKLKPIIEIAVNKAVKSSIEDVFSWSGDGHKAIQKQVKAAMCCDDDMGITQYNDHISKIVRDLVADLFENQALKLLEDNIQEIIEIPPKEIKLSSLIAKFKEEVVNDYQTDEEGEFTCIIKKDSLTNILPWTYISLDKKSDVYDHNCEIRFSVEQKTNEVKILNAFGFDPKTQALEMVGAQHLYGTKKLIFQLFSGGSKLIVDVNDQEVDTYYSREEEEY